MINEKDSLLFTKVQSVENLQDCLSKLKTTSDDARRRPGNKEEDSYLPTIDPFLKDEISLLESKALRRLSRKTQVTSFPTNTNIRNRMSHTLEVMACSMKVGEILGLNLALIRPIVIGHDMGHVPFGHQGEHYLSKRYNSKFCHEAMGPILMQHIEREGRGLNLTHQVLDGMYRHSGNNFSEKMTQEARVVRYCDKIAYLTADYNDFLRMKYPIPSMLKTLINEFGNNQRERVACLISALCHESAEKGTVEFSDSKFAKLFAELRAEMYKIYPRITVQQPSALLDPVMEFLDGLKDEYDPLLFISLMTDQDMEILRNVPMFNTKHIMDTSAGEIINCFHSREGKTIDLINPDLDW